ncbi:Kinase OS=Streptomyces paromomycinus OX=92743 GN=GKJPGBOP_05486 PE=4 SV=1 [Streptomyces rimosus subsp. rimosus]
MALSKGEGGGAVPYGGDEVVSYEGGGTVSSGGGGTVRQPAGPTGADTHAGGLMLAVDAGNSKTDVALVGADGTVLATARGGGFQPPVVGARGPSATWRRWWKRTERAPPGR